MANQDNSMRKHFCWIGWTGIGLGLVIYVASLLPIESNIVNSILRLFATVAFVSGCVFYVKAKGRDAAWGLWGFLGLIGLAGLVLFLDDEAEEHVQ